MSEAPRTPSELPKIVTPPPGPRSRAMSARLAALESPAFEARRAAREEASGADQSPIVYASARGANVLDVDDNRYVDFVAGFGALVLGHAPATIERAVASQHARLGLALGDVYASDVKVALCERLVRDFGEPGARVMLGMSGADAVTAALKTAELATGKPGVVAFRGSYHGLSHGPLAACGLSDAFRAPFAGQVGDFVTFAPYPTSVADLDASMSAVARALGTCGAVLVEPILGRGGCIVPPPSFLGELRRACDRAGALLIADEIWTGVGRSGSLLASRAAEHGASVRADIVCLGKGLGAGLPISACIGSEHAMRAWGAHGGSAIHTATHFGQPIACAAALAALDAIREGRLDERAAVVGASFLEALGHALGDRARVRGRGLMIGVELESAARALAAMMALRARGWLVLTGGAKGNVLTLTPPLDIAEPLLDAFVSTLAEVV